MRTLTNSGADSLPSPHLIRILPSVRHALALLLATCGLAACAGTVGGNGDSTVEPQAEQQRSVAILFVERTAAETSTSSAHVGARFVQLSGMSPTVLPTLLGTPALPGGATGCTERSSDTSALTASDARAEARLIDVGTIDVQADGRTLRLEPRRFPDLWNVVSGVIYATDGELPATDWHFSAPGSAATHLGAFDVDARAPDDLAGVTIADHALAAGGTVSVPRRAFAVRWTRGEREDDVMVTFDGSAGERATTITCTARDEGLLELDTAWAERVADLASTGASVVVHRLRARPFTAAHVENAQVVFDLSVRGRLATE